MVKAGIIGSGFGLYGLLPAFNSTASCKIISICGEKTKRLTDYCQSIGLDKIYTSWQEMLDKETLDAVAIAVTPNAQYYIAKSAIEKGLHIFAEKPLVVNYQQAKELERLAEEKKIVTAIDFMFSEIAEWKKVKQIIDSKALGSLKQINLNWDFLSYDIRNKISSWKTDIKEGGGALSFYFSHSLYYLEYLAGKIMNIKSLFSYSKESMNGGEVGVNLLLEFENNITGYAHLCCNAPGLNRHQLIFIFKKGTVILENEKGITANFVIKVCTEKEIKTISVPKELIKDYADERVAVVRKLTSKFIESIINHQKMTPSFSEGVRVQELIEEIRKRQINK